MTKIDIFSGFLGAGKTTLLKKLISESYKEGKIILVENEFGDVGVDGSFMKETGIAISELNAGCICCSMSGNFVGQLTEMIQWESPDRIIIEPSGVGKLSDITKNINTVIKDCPDDDVKLCGITTVVDAKRCIDYARNFGDFFNDQIDNADCIVLSRTDQIDAVALMDTVVYIQQRNPGVTVITTPWDELAADKIHNAIQVASERKQRIAESKELAGDDAIYCEECGCYHSATDNPHALDGQEFTSWGIETAQKYDADKIENILQDLSDGNVYGNIVRAKGLLPDEEGHWHYFDKVSDEYEIRSGEPDIIGKISVIGQNLNDAEIERLFNIA